MLMEEILSKENFNCNRRCGKCCKQALVRVSRADIKRIKNSGHQPEEFLMNDLAMQDRLLLKVDEKGCIFLKKHNDGRYSCTIYKDRPKICRQYPFFGKENKIKSCFPEKRYSLDNFLVETKKE